MTKLSDLRTFLEFLEDIDAREITSPEEDPGFADRERAGNALNAVIGFLRVRGIHSRALDRLNAQLVDLARTGRRGLIFSPPRPARRQPPAFEIETARAGVAAVVELKSRLGPSDSLRPAAKWVVAETPKAVADAIAGSYLREKIREKKLTVRAIEKWHFIYSQPPLEGESPDGHDTYKSVLRLADTEGYGEAQLISLLEGGFGIFHFRDGQKRK